MATMTNLPVKKKEVERTFVVVAYSVVVVTAVAAAALKAVKVGGSQRSLSQNVLPNSLNASCYKK